LIEGDSNVQERKVKEKGALLLEIDRALHNFDISGSELSGIVMRLGIGKFSETRSAVSTANALSYAWGIPVASIGMDEEASGLLKLFSYKTRGYIVASYSGSPSISTPSQPVN